MKLAWGLRILKGKNSRKGGVAQLDRASDYEVSNASLEEILPRLKAQNNLHVVPVLLATFVYFN